MRLMKLTIKLAFHDVQLGHQALDYIQDRLFDFCSDNLESEITRISGSEQQIDIPDPDPGITEDDDFDRWQTQAAPLLDAL